MNIKAMFYWFLGLLVLAAGARELFNRVGNVPTQKLIGLTIEVVIAIACFYIGYRITKGRPTSIIIHAILIIAATIIAFSVFGLQGGLLYGVR